MKKNSDSASEPASVTEDGEKMADIQKQIREARLDFNAELVIDLTEKLIRMQEEKGCEKEVAHYLVEIAGIYEVMGEKKIAIEKYLEAKKIYLNLPTLEIDVVADIENRLGHMEEDFQGAICLFESQLEMLQKANDVDKYDFSWCFESMAYRYELEGDFRNAIASYQRILDLFEEDKTVVKYILCPSDEDEEPIQKDKDDRSHIAFILHEMGRVYAKMENYDRAYELFDEVFELKEDAEFWRMECEPETMWEEMGQWELNRKNYDNAVKWFQKAYDYNKDLDIEPGNYDGLRKLEHSIQLRNWHLKYKGVKE